MCKQNKKQKHQQKDAGKFFEFFRPDKNLTKSHSVDGGDEKCSNFGCQQHRLCQLSTSWKSAVGRQRPVDKCSWSTLSSGKIIK